MQRRATSVGDDDDDGDVDGRGASASFLAHAAVDDAVGRRARRTPGEGRSWGGWISLISSISGVLVRCVGRETLS